LDISQSEEGIGVFIRRAFEALVVPQYLLLVKRDYYNLLLQIVF
jgi:hypothetical protein